MRRRKIKIQKIPKTAFFVFVYFLISCAFSIFVAVQTAATGAQISKIEENELLLISENNQLNEALLTTSSLTAISEKAESMGFVEAGDIIYSKDSNFTAKLR